MLPRIHIQVSILSMLWATLIQEKALSMPDMGSLNPLMLIAITPLIRWLQHHLMLHYKKEQLFTQGKKRREKYMKIPQVDLGLVEDCPYQGSNDNLGGWESPFCKIKQRYYNNKISIKKLRKYHDINDWDLNHRDVVLYKDKFGKTNPKRMI